MITNFSMIVLILLFLSLFVLTKGVTIYNCQSSHDLYINDPDYEVNCCASDFTITFGPLIQTVTPIECPFLTSVIFSDSVEVIEDYGFYNCSALESIQLGAGIRIIGNYSFAETVVSGEIVFPDSVIEIGESAFYYTHVTAVTFGEGLTKISESAFEGTANLKSIVFSDTIEIIEPFAFCYGLNITSIVWGNGLRKIQHAAFGSSVNIDTIVFPDSVEYIGLAAFVASTIHHIYFGYNLEKIDELAFGYTYLKTIEFSGNNLREIARSVFDSADFTSVELPEGIETLGGYVFYSNTNLATINLPDSLTSIGQYAFQYCSALKTVTVPAGIVNIDDYVFSDAGLETITLPEGIESIGAGTFWHNNHLTTINLPSTLTTIDYAAFQYCKALETITIPDSVIEIGYVSFGQCTSLDCINWDTSVNRTIDANAFDDCPLTGCPISPPKSDANLVIGVTVGVLVFLICIALAVCTYCYYKKTPKTVPTAPVKYVETFQQADVAVVEP